MALLATAAKALLFQAFPVTGGIKFLRRATIFVSERDGIGRLLRRCAGYSQPVVSDFWQRINDLVQPDVLLDIGANYGEIGLSCRYAPHMNVYLIEGNPDIIPFLKKSVASHRDSGHMEVISCIVSDTEGTRTLGVDYNYSGISCVMLRRGPEEPFQDECSQHLTRTEVPMYTVDKLLGDRYPKLPNRLVFKMDVEGFEGHVLRGMEKALDNCEGAMGLLEFDTVYLRRAGTAPLDLIEFLDCRGAIAELTKYGVVEARTKADLLKQLCSREIHMDLIYSTNETRAVCTELFGSPSGIRTDAPFVNRHRTESNKFKHPSWKAIQKHHTESAENRLNRSFVARGWHRKRRLAFSWYLSNDMGP